MLIPVIVILPLLVLTACNDEDERFKDCKDLAKLIRYGEVEDEVIFQLTDMQYACGECLSLYQIDKVLYSEMDQHKFYFNKEIKLSFLNKSLQKQLGHFFCKDENKREVYTFIGHYRRNNLGAGQLDVIGGKMACVDYE